MRTIEILQARIELLKSRAGKDNARIVRKLERRIRAMQNAAD